MKLLLFCISDSCVLEPIDGINCAELGDPDNILDCYSTGLNHNDICSSVNYYYMEPDGSVSYDSITYEYNTDSCQNAVQDEVYLWRCIKGKSIESIECSLN